MDKTSIPHPAAWHLVHTKPRQERTAWENLERQGYSVYLPLLRVSRPQRRRLTSSVVPMFPRYLFVYLSPEQDNFAPIRSTFGVSHLVRFGDLYALLPDAFVASLQNQGNEQGVMEMREPDPIPGDPVVILDGAMAGYEAVFSKYIGKQRVALLLKIAGRQVEIETGRMAVRHT